MIQFYRDTVFEYDGQKSTDIVKGLTICYVGDNDDMIQCGLDRGASFDNNCISVTNNNINTSITLTIFDDEGYNVTQLDNDSLFKINKWLMGGNKVFKPLIQNGFVYYAIFTKGSKWINNDYQKQGYLTYEVELLPYMYSPILLQEVGVNNSTKLFNIECNSNVDEFDINVDIGVRIYNIDNGYLKIENLDNGTVMEFTELTCNENGDSPISNFKIIGADLYGNKNHILLSSVEPSYNLLSNILTKKWITLHNGTNHMRVYSNGFVKLEFKYRNKIQIM